MKKRKKLKYRLGKHYLFERAMDDRAMAVRLRQAPEGEVADIELATLVCGMVKITAWLCDNGRVIAPLYEISVRESLGSDRWYCYDFPSDEVRLSEDHMFAVLESCCDRYHLSYTESNFTVYEGMEPVKEKPPYESL